MAINWKNDNNVAICWHDVIVKIFWPCCISLVKFSYWFKFHVNIVTGSRVMTIFFYTGLTRNPEIGNVPVWISPNIWRLGRVRNTKFGSNVSNKMWLNTGRVNAGFTALTFSELLRENQQVEGVILILPSCAFHFMEIFRLVEIRAVICLYLQSGLEFLTKLCSSDPSFNGNILTSLYLKSETSAHT